MNLARIIYDSVRAVLNRKPPRDPWDELKHATYTTARSNYGPSPLTLESLKAAVAKIPPPPKMPDPSMCAGCGRSLGDAPPLSRAYGGRKIHIGAGLRNASSGLIQSFLASDSFVFLCVRCELQLLALSEAERK